MNEPPPLQQDHNLPQVLGGNLLVLGDFLDLYGPPNFVIVDKLG
jgi:hypothetical protein